MSTLGRFAASMRDPDPKAARRLAKDGYHGTGLVVIHPDWLPSWTDRKQLEILANKVHGTRKVKA